MSTNLPKLRKLQVWLTKQERDLICTALHFLVNEALRADRTSPDRVAPECSGFTRRRCYELIDRVALPRPAAKPAEVTPIDNGKAAPPPPTTGSPKHEQRAG